MKSYETLKKERISHLEWCLEKLQLRENKLTEEDFRYIYHYVFCTMKEMQNMDAPHANEYYKERMWKESIKKLLAKYNIEMSV